MEETKFDTLKIGGAEVVVGSNVFEAIPDKISAVSKEGAICIVYDKKLKDIAIAVGDSLHKLKRRIFLCELDKTKPQTDAVPDYIRYIIAVGCGFAAMRADKIARAISVPWSMVLTAPTTDTILQGKSPKHVFIDKNMMINCEKRFVAAGLGALFARRITAFESEFARVVLSSGDGAKLIDVKGEIDACSLAVALLELSTQKQFMSSAECAAHIMRAKAVEKKVAPLLVGEYEFILASYILKLYSFLLSSPSIDVCLPPTREEDFDTLSKIGCDYLVKQSKSIDFFETNSYFRISYILSEYRTDLLDKLRLVESKTAQRIWRRVYDDAGYFLKQAVRIGDVEDAVLLAGSVNENLLGFAYAQGALRACTR